jgi:CheY-like chemotaxis protein
MQVRDLRPSILVVDDDWPVADSLAMILTQKGYRVRPVYSGEEAVDAARDLRPDYLITDIYMYTMSGIEAARTIRERLPGCKVILFPGNVDADDLMNEAARDGQVFPFLRKPFHPEILLQQLGSQG